MADATGLTLQEFPEIGRWHAASTNLKPRACRFRGSRANSSAAQSNALHLSTDKENPMQVQPYLSFNGRCEEALEFYRKALGAEVTMLMRFKESPDSSGCGMMPPGSENKVMHAEFRVGDTGVMASDGQCTGNAVFQGISLSIAVPDEAKARQLFAALGDGGQVQMPMDKTFFSPCFGMVADRFGVSWMVVVPS
jgi:PhnB protein